MMKFAPAETVWLPSLLCNGVELNFFCSLRGPHPLEKVLATCVAWLDVAGYPGSAEMAGTEDAWYSYAQERVQATLTGLLDPDRRAQTAREALDLVGRVPLNREVQALLRNHFKAELAGAHAIR